MCQLNLDKYAFLATMSRFSCHRGPLLEVPSTMIGVRCRYEPFHHSCSRSYNSHQPMF
ncbi:hypothetical protein HanPSC8_Chr03g0095121 [Helianthus annuus]|nr:hypothetical protein HanPSC8_Chr03g0095121 [Helianthus annuus]